MPNEGIWDAVPGERRGGVAAARSLPHQEARDRVLVLGDILAPRKSPRPSAPGRPTSKRIRRVAGVRPERLPVPASRVPARVHGGTHVYENKRRLRPKAMAVKDADCRTTVSTQTGDPHPHPPATVQYASGSPQHRNSVGGEHARREAFVRTRSPLPWARSSATVPRNDAVTRRRTGTHQRPKTGVPLLRSRSILAVGTALCVVPLVAGCASHPTSRSTTSSSSRAATDSGTSRSASRLPTGAAPSSASPGHRSGAGHGYPACVTDAYGRQCSEKSLSYALSWAKVRPYSYSTARDAPYFAPTTWSLPAPATTERPIHSLPAPAFAEAALATTPESEAPFPLVIYSGWQVTRTTRVWIGEWQGTGTVGAITVNSSSSTATYHSIGIHQGRGPFVACAPGSACVNGVEVVGIKGDEILVLYGAGGYSVFNWKSGLGVPCDNNGVPSEKYVPPSLLSKVNEQ